VTRAIPARHPPVIKRVHDGECAEDQDGVAHDRRGRAAKKDSQKVNDKRTMSTIEKSGDARHDDRLQR